MAHEEVNVGIADICDSLGRDDTASGSHDLRLRVLRRDATQELAQQTLDSPLYGVYDPSPETR